MSGWLNIACRLNDGTVHVTEAHSRNARDLYARDLTFLQGDDSGAKSYLDWHRSLGADLSNEPLRENEYGVLAVDFVEKVILFNRDDWNLAKGEHFSWQNPHAREMAFAGRVKLVCPDGSVSSLQITSDLKDCWNQLVDDPRASAREGDLLTTPFPARYYLREPTPLFVYDYAPWTIRQFNEMNDADAFFDALEASGFMVDRSGWRSKFE